MQNGALYFWVIMSHFGSLWLIMGHFGLFRV